MQHFSMRLKLWLSALAALMCVCLLLSIRIRLRDDLISRRVDELIWGIPDKASIDGKCIPRTVNLSDHDLPITTLASCPGSGNTWTRHLLQQASGIGTSSVYCSKRLLNNGYPFECHHTKFNRTLVVKTHEKNGVYDKVVVLIRNPFEQIVSSFQWKEITMTDAHAVSNYTGEAWHEHIQIGNTKWLKFHQYWLTVPRPDLPLFYTKLKENMKPELTRVLDFLRVNYTQADLDCTVKLQEGTFHRPPFQVNGYKIDIRDLYNKTEKMIVQSSIDTISDLLKRNYSLDSL